MHFARLFSAVMLLLTTGCTGCDSRSGEKPVTLHCLHDPWIQVEINPHPPLPHAGHDGGNDLTMAHVCIQGDVFGVRRDGTAVASQVIVAHMEQLTTLVAALALHNEPRVIVDVQNVIITVHHVARPIGSTTAAPGVDDDDSPALQVYRLILRALKQ